MKQLTEQQKDFIASITFEDIDNESLYEDFHIFEPKPLVTHRMVAAIEFGTAKLAMYTHGWVHENGNIMVLDELFDMNIISKVNSLAQIACVKALADKALLNASTWYLNRYNKHFKNKQTYEDYKI